MTQLTRRTPERTLRTLQHEVDNIFDRFFGRRREEPTASPGWSPQADLTETDEAYTIRLDVPGVTKDNINVNLQGNSLTISGERSGDWSAEGEERVRVERVFGTFNRTFTLPEAVDHENIEASYDDGVLTITVPKTEESTRRQIEIQ